MECVTYLGPVTDAISFSDLQERLDGLLQSIIHVVVVEDTGGATVCELVGVGLPKVVPWERPVIQS